MAETILQPQVFILRVVIYMLTMLRWPTPCRCGVRALVFGCCPPFQVRLGRIKRSVFLSPHPITAIPPRRCDGAPPRPQGSECAAGRRACGGSPPIPIPVPVPVLIPCAPPCRRLGPFLAIGFAAEIVLPALGAVVVLHEPLAHAFRVEQVVAAWIAGPAHDVPGRVRAQAYAAEGLIAVPVHRGLGQQDVVPVPGVLLDAGNALSHPGLDGSLEKTGGKEEEGIERRSWRETDALWREDRPRKRRRKCNRARVSLSVSVSLTLVISSSETRRLLSAFLILLVLSSSPAPPGPSRALGSSSAAPLIFMHITMSATGKTRRPMMET